MADETTGSQELEMKIRKLVCAAAVAGMTFFAAASNAAVQHFSLTFDGSISLIPGIGALDWDSAAETMSSMSWDFGGGMTGGIRSSALGIGPGSLGYLIAQTLGLEPGAPGPGWVYFSGVDPLIAPFPSTNVVLCRGAANFFCGGPVNDQIYYRFDNAGALAPEQFAGVLTLRASNVPEPAPVALLCAGFFAVAMSRRRRTLPAGGNHERSHQLASSTMRA